MKRPGDRAMRRLGDKTLRRLGDFGAVVAGCAVGVAAFYFPAARELRALHAVDCRAEFDTLAAKKAAAKDLFFASPSTCTVGVLQPADSPVRYVDFDFRANVATYHFNAHTSEERPINRLSPLDTVVAKKAAEHLPLECTMLTRFAALP